MCTSLPMNFCEYKYLTLLDLKKTVVVASALGLEQLNISGPPSLLLTLLHPKNANYVSKKSKTRILKMTWAECTWCASLS